MSDKQRVLDLLIERGAEGVTSHELRISGTTGNPSERCRELIADGHEIEAEQTHRVDPHGKKRPMTIYRLRDVGSQGTGQTMCGGLGESAWSSGAGAGSGEVGPSSVAACCGPARSEGDAAPGESPAGVEAPAGFPRLFEIDDKQSYYEREAA